MDPTTIKQSIYTAMKPFLPERTIWANPNAPRPSMPYGTIQLTGSDTVGSPTFEEVDANGIILIKGQTDDVLEVQYYGEDAWENLKHLRDMMATTRLRYPMLRAGIVPYATSKVTDMTQLMGGIETEERAMMQISIRYRSDINDDVGLIESVDTTGSTIAGLPVDMIINKP